MGSVTAPFSHMLTEDGMREWVDSHENPEQCSATVDSLNNLADASLGTALVSAVAVPFVAPTGVLSPIFMGAAIGSAGSFFKLVDLANRLEAGCEEKFGD